MGLRIGGRPKAGIWSRRCLIKIKCLVHIAHVPVSLGTINGCGRAFVPYEPGTWEVFEKVTTLCESLKAVRKRDISANLRLGGGKNATQAYQLLLPISLLR